MFAPNRLTIPATCLLVLVLVLASPLSLTTSLNKEQCSASQ